MARKHVPPRPVDVRNQSSRIQLCGICLLVIGLPFVIAALVVLALIPIYTNNHSDDINRSNENHTDLWLVQYYTNRISKETNNLAPINTAALGTSLDEVKGLKSGSSMVSAADFISDTNVRTVKRFRRQNTAQQNNTSDQVFLDIYLQFRYPDQCRGIRQCQQLFRKRVLSKFLDPRPFDISILLIDGVIISVRLSLYRIVENYVLSTTATTLTTGITSSSLIPAVNTTPTVTYTATTSVKPILLNSTMSTISNITMSTLSTTAINTPSTESPVICTYPDVLTSIGTCANVLLDPTNCGMVGNICNASYRSCSGGVCSTAPSVVFFNPIIVWMGALNGSVDDRYFNVTLPFNITLYNKTTNHVAVSTNGILCLDGCSDAYNARPLPTSVFAGTTAFPFWDDLYIANGTSQGIYYTIINDAPNRIIVFEYYMSRPYDNSEYYHFGVVLSEGDPGIVQYEYLEIADGGGKATVGVQNSNRGPFIQYSYRQPDSVLSGTILYFDTNQNTYSGELLCGLQPCDLNEACVRDLCVERGSLSFTAQWSHDNGQGYIIVRSPLNNTLYYGHATSNSSLDGGQYEQVGNGSEVDNIYWPLGNTVPVGVYSICFSTGSLFTGNDTSPVTVTIEIRRSQYATQTVTRTFNMSTNDLSECTDTSDTFVASFGIRWSTITTMSTHRFAHTASVSSGGKVLVVGGFGGLTVLNTAELYDSSSENWTNVANMSSSRAYHTASILSGDKVLVVGGATIVAILNTAELYDSSSENWTNVASMSSSRAYHTASVLTNDTVLVVGGFNNLGIVNTAELYNMSTGNWTNVANMNSSRVYHTASVLSDGKVLVVGGYNGKVGLSSAELYNPSSNNWTRVANMSVPRGFHTASVLSGDKVLVVGGFNGNDFLSTAELYDSSSGNWTNVASMSGPRDTHTASVLSADKVLVVGGFNGNVTLRSAELYNPLSENWTTTDDMSTSLRGHTASVLTSDTVLVAGGDDDGSYPLNTAEIYYL